MSNPEYIKFTDDKKINELKNDGVEIIDYFDLQIEELCKVKNPKLTDNKEGLEVKKKEYNTEYGGQKAYYYFPCKKLCIAYLPEHLFFEKANLCLQELDRQKTEFFSIVSHQFRTPMSIIKGYIELIQDEAYGKITKDTFKILSDMDKTNERLVKLIDEFLDISRIEQGITKFVFEMHDMKELIDSVVKEMTQRSIDKGLKIEWKPGKGKAEVCMDDEKVRHVVFNFIDNAIKYSEKGVIKVTIEKLDDGISVRVKDNGIGFDKVDEANFFQKFYRGSHVKTINIGGTGLGIYVAKKFIEKHDGRVWAKSEGLGKGGEFGFYLPLNKDKAGAETTDKKQKSDGGVEAVCLSNKLKIKEDIK